MLDHRSPLLTPMRAAERASPLTRLQARVRSLQSRARARGEGERALPRRGRRR
jgi:hypothetical protein